MAVRMLLAALLLGLTACSGSGATPPTVPATPATPTLACPATQPNGSTPPGENPSSAYLGNGALWTVLWPEGTVIIPADQAQAEGSLSMKFPWWRGPSVRGALTITGRRLDAPAPPLRARIPAGYGDTGFQSTAFIFPTYGCWEVTGKAGDASLTFVTLVAASATPATPAAIPGPACAVSPDTTHNANGHLLEGKRGGGIFIYPAVGRVFTANRPEKFLVFLDPLPTSPPSPLLVHGHNRTTGTTMVFENAQHLSEYGTEWGTNYYFPDAGCWELALEEQGMRGMVVIAVAP